MKKIFKSALLLISGICLLTACENDRDSNPVIDITKTNDVTFLLNAPAYATNAIDLKNTSDSIQFTWKQPDFGFPIAAQYKMQISLDGSFTTSYADAQADATGATIADFYEFDNEPVRACKQKLSTEDIAKGMQLIGGWGEDNVPDLKTAYIRVKAMTAGLENVYSNALQLSFAPYYVVLKEAQPLLWYLVGNCIGDGSWGNEAGKIGTSLIPMFTITGEEYDKATGEGKTSYTGYFPEGGQFKLIKTPGNWDIQKNFSSFEGIDESKFETNNDGNVCIKTGAAGYYTITFDTKEDVITIEPYEGTPSVCTSMALPGGHNGWNETNAEKDGNAPTALTAAETSANAECHIWTLDLNLVNDAEVKFAANNGWDKNWGCSDFPYGTGTQGGDNIKAKAGKYQVFFNDITGQYMFIEK
jgi:hypothetical protein